MFRCLLINGCSGVWGLGDKEAVWNPTNQELVRMVWPAGFPRMSDCFEQIYQLGMDPPFSSGSCLTDDVASRWLYLEQPELAVSKESFPRESYVKF